MPLHNFFMLLYACMIICRHLGAVILDMSGLDYLNIHVTWPCIFSLRILEISNYNECSLLHPP